MLNTYRLQITTPKGNIFDGQVHQLSLRATDGDLAVLAGHIPLCTAVVPCTGKIYDGDGHVVSADIGGGILQVLKDKTVLLTSSFSWTDSSGN